MDQLNIAKEPERRRQNGEVGEAGSALSHQLLILLDPMRGVDASATGLSSDFSLDDFKRALISARRIPVALCGEYGTAIC
mmetsp:Transcript_124488/g.232794  ORF Transcript_124488/g.232794 Transcript_124488/m.232794 type:complete len:80 (+) Transcript_124488:3-242(+)